MHSHPPWGLSLGGCFRQGSEQRYYLYNGHGDVIGLADASGLVTWRYDYDAFGNEKGIAGQDPDLDANPFSMPGSTMT